MEEEAAEEPSAHGKFTLLLIMGFALIFLGMIVLMISALLQGNATASFGGIIFIGPIPIVFGAGPDATLMAVVSIILAVICILMFIMLRRQLRSP